MAFVEKNTRRRRIGILDYRRGNLRSVENAVLVSGGEAVVISDPSDIENFDALILPGVGSFGDCALNLREAGLEAPILKWISEGRPFLGICVGYQLLFEGSEESPEVPGLGILKGHVKRFSNGDARVPHMGWNSLRFAQPQDPLLKNISEDSQVYFVHSYYPEPEGEDVAYVSMQCSYAGIDFAASIWRERLWATQFHPEKSQRIGLQMLRNFVNEISA
ncbi:MAG: imidazole glycerol phosphate synthase subunit HisH [Chthoniobacterales bacterium]